MKRRPSVGVEFGVATRSRLGFGPAVEVGGRVHAAAEPEVVGAVDFEMPASAAACDCGQPSRRSLTYFALLRAGTFFGTHRS
jgi:hypothetical protein